MISPHVTEKLPLWVGGDLSNQEMKLVQEHLNTCQACQIEAKRYSEALAWLKEPTNTGATNSPFTQEDFRSVRNSVMAQIRKTTTDIPQKSIPKKSGKHLAPYLPWLLAAAIPAAIILYGGKEYLLPKGSVATVSASAEPNDSIGATGANSAPAPQVAPLADSVQPAASLSQLAAKPKAVHKQSAGFLLAKNQPASFQQDGTITRIEFQTEDPNIKIIWFPNPHPSTISL
ncbi:MAG: zf-HC2 domain-containing protein [Holophagales bacterium]|jgi:hypothetical protein|nr:zf-HC2 domain-containing protein [Holophagales bacterium]